MEKYNKHKSIHKYMTFLSDPNTDSDYYVKHTISALYKYLENYLTISTNQLNRVNAEMNNILQQSKDNPTYPGIEYDVKIHSGDLHFLLISLEKCYSLSMQIYSEFNLKEKQMAIKNSTKYKIVKQIRNCLEHMDENLSDDSTLHPEYREISPYPSSSDTNWFEKAWGSQFLNKIIFRKKNNKIYILKLDLNTLNDIITYYDDISNIIDKKYIRPNKNIVDRILKNHLPN